MRVHVSSLRQCLQCGVYLRCLDVHQLLLDRTRGRKAAELCGTKLPPFEIVQIIINSLLVLESQNTTTVYLNE